MIYKCVIDKYIIRLFEKTGDYEYTGLKPYHALPPYFEVGDNGYYTCYFSRTNNILYTTPQTKCISPLIDEEKLRLL